MDLLRDVIDGVQIAAIIDRGQLMAVYAQPDDARPWIGDLYGAQVTRFSPAQRAYFLDLGPDGEGFLPANKNIPLQPGQKITVQVERPATRDKHLRCSFADDQAAGLGRLQRGGDVVVQAQQDFPSTVLIGGDLQDFDEAILDLLNPNVVVQEGISLVIERVTALTAIDVNNADPSMTPLEVNRIVTKALAQQMRLRNLNGQIVVDFLRMRDPKHRETLASAFQQAVTFDPCIVELLGFTRLGLYELTRAKRGLPLDEVFALVQG